MQNQGGLKRVDKEEKFLSKFSSLMTFKNVKNDEENPPQQEQQEQQEEVVINQSQKEERVRKFQNQMSTDEERNQWISLSQEISGKYEQLVGTIKKTKTKIKQNGVDQGELDERDPKEVNDIEEEQKFILQKSQGYYEYAPYYPNMNHNKRQQINDIYVDPDVEQYYATDPIKKHLRLNTKFNQKISFRPDFTKDGLGNHKTHLQFHNNVYPNSLIVEQNIGRYLTNFAVQLKLDLIESFDDDYVTINGVKCSYQQVPKQLMTVINHYEDIYKLHFFKQADLKNIHNQELPRLTQQQQQMIQAARKDLSKIEEQFKEKKNIKIDDLNTSSNTEQEIQYFKELIPKEKISNHLKLQIIHNVLQGYNNEKVRLTVPQLEVVNNENKDESQEDMQFLTDNSYSEVSLGKVHESLSDDSVTTNSNDSDVQDFLFDKLNGNNKQKKTFTIKPAFYKKQIIEQNQKSQSKQQKKKVNNKLSLQIDDGKLKILKKNNLIVQREVDLTEQQFQYQDKNEEISSDDYDSSQDSEESEIIVKKELFEIPKQAWNLDNIGIYNQLKKRGEPIDDKEESQIQEVSNQEMERLIRTRLDETKNKQLDDIIKDLDNKEQNEMIDFQINKQLFAGEFKRQIEMQTELSRQKQEQQETNAEQNALTELNQKQAIQTMDIEYFNRFRIPGTNHIDFANMKNSEIRRYYDLLKKNTDPFADGTEFMQIFKFKDLDLERVGQMNKPQNIDDSDDENKVVDKIEKIHKKFKYHKLILQNGLYQGIDLYQMDIIDQNGKRYKNNQRIGKNKEQDENSQSYHSVKQQDSQRSNKDKKAIQQTQVPQSQQSKHMTQNQRPQAKLDKREKVNERLQLINEYNGDINFIKFHREFAKKAERYNELEIDHEEVVNAPVQRMNYEEFLESLQRIEINKGKDSNATQERIKVIKNNQKPDEIGSALLQREKLKKVDGLAKDTKVKRNYKQNDKKEDQSDQDDRIDEDINNNDNYVLFDDSQDEENENIRNFDLEYPRQKIVRPDDFLAPLISVINLRYPTDALNKILQEEDLQFVKPFLKSQIYKNRINERIFDININPIAQIKTSPLFEAYQFYKQHMQDNSEQLNELNNLQDSNESFYSVDPVNQKVEDFQDAHSDSELDEKLLIQQHLETLEQQKSELKNIYRIEEQVDPRFNSDKYEQYAIQEDSNESPNIYEMKVEQPMDQQFIKQENKGYIQQEELQEEFTHGNITMGSFQSDNPIMKILQQSTNNDDDQQYYDSSYQSQEEDRQSNKDKRNKPRPNTLSSKLGFDKKNQQIVEQPHISFDPNQQFDRSIFEAGFEQSQVEKDTGIENIEQKFLKNPDQEDDYKDNGFLDYFTVELSQITTDKINREVSIAEKQQIPQDYDILLGKGLELEDYQQYQQLSLVQMMENYKKDLQKINFADHQNQSENQQIQQDYSQYQFLDENINQSGRAERYDSLNRSLYKQDEDDENIVYEKRLSNLSTFIDVNSSSEKKPKKILYKEKQPSGKKELYKLYEDQELLNVEDVEIAKLLLQGDLLRKDEAEMVINNKKFAENCDKFCMQLCAQQGFDIHQALDFAARDNVHLQMQDYLRYDILYNPIISVYDKFKQPDMTQLIQIIFEYLKEHISYEDKGPGILFSYVDRYVQEWYYEEDKITNDITQIPYAQVFRALVHIANKINLKLVQRKDDEETDFLIYLAKGQRRLDEIDFFISDDDI